MNENVILKSGDKIHFILYSDHATIKDENLDLDKSLEQLRKDPHILWCCGKILNEKSSDPFYAVLCSGAMNYFKKPYNYETIQKNCILSKKVIYTIP